MRIVIFASGNGSNAVNIIKYFSDNQKVKVVAVFSNKKEAKVLDKTNKLKIPAFSFNKFAFEDPECIPAVLHTLKPDLIVLAGFLWKIPKHLVTAFPNKIINIHPSLLPKYGGKGMYGTYVHQAVLDNREKETGITIHYVNEEYDEGAIIFQKAVTLTPEDTIETIAAKVHELEYAHFPETIEKVLNAKLLR